MQKIEDLVKDVIHLAYSSGLSIQGVAKVANLHKNTLKGMYKPGWQPTITTLKNLQNELLKFKKLSAEEQQKYAILRKVHPP